MYDIVTSIEIDASPERVWDVLTNFREYDEWNPFIRHLKGSAAPGERLSFVAQFRGRDLPISARFVRLEPNREIRWHGPTSSVLGKLFRGEHYIRLEPAGDGRTRVEHGEQFGGVLVGFVWERFKDSVMPQYIAMNEGLKRRAEAS